MPNIRDFLPQPPWEGPPVPRSWHSGSWTLPTKAEMDELDRLFEKVSGILINWRFKMSPSERREFPAAFQSIDRIEKSLLVVSDALAVISEELGFGALKEE